MNYEDNDYPELSVKLKQLPDIEDKLAHQRKSYANLEVKVTDAKDKRDCDFKTLIASSMMKNLNSQSKS